MLAVLVVLVVPVKPGEEQEDLSLANHTNPKASHAVSAYA